MEFWKAANSHHRLWRPGSHKNRLSYLASTEQFRKTVYLKSSFRAWQNQALPLPTLHYKNLSDPSQNVFVYCCLFVLFGTLGYDVAGFRDLSDQKQSLLLPFWSWTDSILSFSSADYFLHYGHVVLWSGTLSAESGVMIWIWTLCEGPMCWNLDGQVLGFWKVIVFGRFWSQQHSFTGLLRNDGNLRDGT